MLSYLFSFIPEVPLLGILVLAALGLFIFLAVCFRVVVPTNSVHIVQSGRKTVSYGKDQTAGNVYYSWPSWVPLFGIRVIEFPVSVFSISLDAYAAYDKGRVPFVIDIMAFFRIDDPNTAAARVGSFKELTAQLEGILQGASRSILAKSEIEEILEERAKYGTEFTAATNDQLKAWGVTNVKNIELMDIRDTQSTKVVANIMAKKQSLIEKESRIMVAQNGQAAQQAEIEAGRQVAVSRQEAEEQVGTRTAQKDQQIGVSKQKAQQQIQEEERATMEKTMAVTRVKEVQSAEIQRDVQVVAAEQAKRVNIIDAEGIKQNNITVAEGDLEKAKLHAQGVEAEGRAKGEAEKAILLAPVEAQIRLAAEIGTNPGYQTYLVTVRQIEAMQAVGMEQAKALEKADIKVISNAGTPTEGLTGVMDLMTPKGGTMLGAALEALKNTPAGKAVVEAVTKGK